MRQLRIEGELSTICDTFVSGEKALDLVINAQFGKVAEETILITNVGDEPALYQVSSDLYEKNVIISQIDFQL